MKPCPFCQCLEIDVSVENSSQWFAVCAYCDARGPVAANVDEARAGWNRQPSPFAFLPEPVLVMLAERFAAHCAAEEKA